MKTQSKGLVALFLDAASVRGRGRNELSKNTRRAYLAAIRAFWQFTGGKPASQWTRTDVEDYLRDLHSLNYSRSSRKTSLCALVYVFKHVLRVDLGELDLPPMPMEKRTLKIIPSRAELGRIFAGMKGMVRTMAGVMYGAGLRVNECCTLRVKDIDIEALTIRVHCGKGDKDRLALLPENLAAPMLRQIEWRRALHESDLADGCGLVELPGRYGIKNKGAERDFRWQYLFPSALIRGQKRWHITPAALQKSMRAAVKSAGITKLVTPHTLRHAFCTHAQQVGNDIATVAALMGHETIETTQLYSHADKARGVSPLDVAPVMIVRNAPPSHALSF